MSTHKWTSTSASPAVLKEGQLACQPYHPPRSVVAEGEIRAGLLVQRGTDPEDQVKAVAALAAADDDAIALHLASAAAPTWYTADADIDDGVIGKGEIFPASSLMFTFDASADWDATTGVVVGVDADGHYLEERIDIATSTVYYTRGHFKRVLGVFFPTQTGAGGVCKVGVDATYGMSVSPKDSGVAVYDRAREPSDTSTVTFDDNETLSVLQAGQIAVTVEHAVVPGDPVGVRFVLAGADVRGQFDVMPAQAPGSKTFALLTGARFLTTTAADGIAIVELGG